MAPSQSHGAKKHGSRVVCFLKLLTRLFLSKRFNVIFFNIRVSLTTNSPDRHTGHMKIFPEGLRCGGSSLLGSNQRRPLTAAQNKFS